MSPPFSLLSTCFTTSQPPAIHPDLILHHTESSHVRRRSVTPAPALLQFLVLLAQVNEVLSQLGVVSDGLFHSLLQHLDPLILVAETLGICIFEFAL